jgi:hypothetical protein
MINQNTMQPNNNMVEQEPQYTLTPPTASNQMGASKPLFSNKEQSNASSMFGSEEQRQTSLANPPFYKLDPMYNGKPGVQKEDFKQFTK